MLSNFLHSPDLKKCLDSPETTIIHRKIISEKPFLQRIYKDWYKLIKKWIPGGRAPIIEIGSGPGFLREFIPGAVRSEVLPIPGSDLVFDACSGLPFGSSGLRAIILVNVFHHLHGVRKFLSEVDRCLIPGGALIMIEPWMTDWSRFVYSTFHHEPCCPERETWDFVPKGRLSCSNQALPWMVFHRDRRLFEAEFPELKIKKIVLMMPIRYIVSGGLSSRSGAPGVSYRIFSMLERLAKHEMHYLAMFAGIRVVKHPELPLSGL